jgi:hypothetical protein
VAAGANAAPGWREGWTSLLGGNNKSGLALRERAAKRPVHFDFAPLPARYFCSGHLFWVRITIRRGYTIIIHYHTNIKILYYYTINGWQTSPHCPQGISARATAFGCAASGSKYNITILLFLFTTLYFLSFFIIQLYYTTTLKLNF